MSAPTLDQVEQQSPMTHREIMEALSGLLLVLFVAMASSTIVSTALPKIIGDLNGSQTQYTWVVTATLLTATATTPIWGKLSDLYSKKLLVQLSIVLFVLGSLAAGFTQTTEQLIAARAFQGLGMGGVQALVQVAIAAMIPPRERGRYNGYLGGVLALATVAGPLLGGVIVDTEALGWRWCFFIGAPFAVIALLVLQKTLHLPVIRRENVKVDYLGATLIAAGVSTILIWVSFVDDSFGWVSWQTFAMVGGGLALLGIATWVESRVAEPVVPLSIVRQRTTALAILGSLAVGMAMFGGSVFLGQYFQIGRGYSPTEAGLLMIPMMFGIMLSSTIAGKAMTKSGKIKPYVVAGTIILVIGFAGLSVLDHETPLWYIGSAMALVGIGVGMSMQNLVLAVQNTVSLKDIGAASSTVAFFRSLGGTIGVSVLGAVLARRVTDSITEQLTAMGVPAGGSSGTSSLNLSSLPESIQHVVRAAYGDATGHIFLISMGVAVIGVVAAVAMKPAKLRSTVDVSAPAKVPASTK
ncbi:EmrB/QacA family drug resistance transporter [Actinoplanes lobatus]|uniref:EmrB/QacA family drug resistance transporter n=1 Tax=Actinoplanes lobatus TaxID=113568 RepID=A0A7W7HBV3_9ACTN|nr:MDR family MFS transporter [Actinoplanes lobatus]MBB4747626.1 EmrB/QacA subfamily drug resistance transporter [Actinoplanes lobatus]GGN73809.1 EmrB/QacA family drug resistance transporter [Actinoplanes lobatus]GIE39812.1 EmrB/QacA family drug resistance transporter [Actinoplanes lobatus]